MFRRFTLYIDIVASPKYYAPILSIIETTTEKCEPITNISEQFEKPNFLYNLLIIEYDKLDFDNNTLRIIQDSYKTTIVLNVPNDEHCYALLHKNNIHFNLRTGFFDSELEVLLNEYLKVELITNDNTLLDNLFNSAQNSIVIADKRGNIQYANPYFEVLSEYSKDELIEHSPKILKSGQHLELFYTQLWDKISQGFVWEDIFINKSKSGKLFYEEATITPIFNSHGSIEKYLKIGKNITREKMLLAELSKEIKVAKKVLTTFLPPPYKDEILEFNYISSDFNEIGGDFIYFKKAFNNKYYISIIDVMGHGVSSALIALTVTQMFDDHIGYLKIDETVSEINKMLCHINHEDMDESQYVTGIFIEIDYEKKKIDYVNAGHPDMVLLYKDLTHTCLTSNNMMLGIEANEIFNLDSIDYQAPGKLIMFTDGLYENHDMTLDQALDLIVNSSKKILSPNDINLLFGNYSSVKDDSTISILEFA